MKIISLRDAEASRDIDIKMMATRSSRYRVFGSSERIKGGEMAVIDLRDGIEPPDFAAQFTVLDRHQVKAICLVRKLGDG
jgi:predicted transcriptional regulator of viral defense system